MHHVTAHHTTVHHAKSTPTVPTAVVKGTYTVRAGDYLSRIAVQHHVKGGWQTLAHLNRATVHNPNLIFVGQHIKV